LVLVAGLAAGAAAHADFPAGNSVPPAGEVLTIEKALAWALHFSPELAVFRKQRGIAAANLVIARTYPFNPIWQSFTMAAGGPETAGITNRVFVENTFRLDLELRGQGKYRTGAANAAATRTEWEIAAQELALAVRTVRAFNAFVYRQEKLHLLEDTIKLQEEITKNAKRLGEQGKLKPADVMLANSDLVETRALRGPSLALVVAAWNDLRRTIGADLTIANYQGSLDPWAPADNPDSLMPRAMDLRPDLRALQLAVAEADQRVQFEVANRWGNPSLGPAMEYNETRVTFVGAWMITPLPTLNTRRGDIMLRKAERDRAAADERRVEIQTTLDVRAAVARVREAQRWVNYFGAESLPVLQSTMESFEKLFAAGDPGVDVLRLIDARRRLVRARDGYLDALWELAQARADLAAAVGDLSLAIGTSVALPAAADCAAPQVQLLPPVMRPE
jgi:outer membrane protein TolC